MTLFGCFLLLDHPRDSQTHFGKHVRSMLKYGTRNGFFVLFCFVLFCFHVWFSFFFLISGFVFVVFSLKLESWEQVFAKMCVCVCVGSQIFAQNLIQFGLRMQKIFKKYKWGLELELKKCLKWWVFGTKKVA